MPLSLAPSQWHYSRPQRWGLEHLAIAAVLIHLLVPELQPCVAPLAGQTSAFAFASWPRLHAGSFGARSRDAVQSRHRTSLRAAVPERMKVADLRVGMEVNGIIHSVRNFGCFVDIGAERDGLVHISQMNMDHVRDIHAIAHEGQAVRVWIVDITEDGKLELSMIGASKDQKKKDLKLLMNLPPDQWLDATVESITDARVDASVEVPGRSGSRITGSIQKWQMSDDMVKHPSDVVKIGDQVRVRLLPASFPKVWFSMREPDNKALSLFADVDPSTWFRGTVYQIMTFGVFVKVPSPQGGKSVHGFVHIAQIRPGTVADPKDEVRMGETLDVRVLRCDMAKQRLELSMLTEQEETLKE